MPASLGTLLHKRLAAHYGGQPWDPAAAADTGPSRASISKYSDWLLCQRMYAYRWVLGLQKRAAENHRESGQADEVFDAYVRHWAQWDNRMRPIAIEHEIVVGLAGGQVSCRIDLIAELNGRVILMDHKTAARPESRMRGTRFEPSLLIQEILFEASGLSFGLSYGGFVLNVIGTGTAEHFERKIIRFDGSVKKELVASLVSAKVSLDTATHCRDAWSYRMTGMLTGNCIGKYGVCKYRPLCLGGVDALGDYEETKWPAQS